MDTAANRQQAKESPTLKREQICLKCLTVNSHYAIYCKNCGAEIETETARKARTDSPKSAG